MTAAWQWEEAADVAVVEAVDNSDMTSPAPIVAGDVVIVPPPAGHAKRCARTGWLTGWEVHLPAGIPGEWP